MRVTCYLEVLSSWCFWAEPMWAKLKADYAGTVAFDWQIALMRPEAFPVSRSQCDVFYQRSGSVVRSDRMLNSGWFEPELAGDYTVPNLVAEAGKDLGYTDDRLRMALSRAALVHGRKIGRLDEAIAVVVEDLDVDGADLRAAATSDAVRARVQASTETFLSFQIDQRPGYVVTSGIGDTAIFSGVVAYEPIAETIRAMTHDAQGYAAYHAHFGDIPDA